MAVKGLTASFSEEFLAGTEIPGSVCQCLGDGGGGGGKREEGGWGRGADATLSSLQ